jgi:hypothetical protein
MKTATKKAAANPIGEYHLSTPELTRNVMGLVCSGLESGSYGSFIIVGYKKPPKMEIRFDERDETVYKHFEYPFQTGGATLFVDKYEAEDTGLSKEDACNKLEKAGKKLVLDRAAIVKGMQLFMEKYPRMYADFVGDGGDAITGDAFVQCCLLGEVVYG